MCVCVRVCKNKSDSIPAHLQQPPTPPAPAPPTPHPTLTPTHNKKHTPATVRIGSSFSSSVSPKSPATSPPNLHQPHPPHPTCHSAQRLQLLLPLSDLTHLQQHNPTHLRQPHPTCNVRPTSNSPAHLPQCAAAQVSPPPSGRPAGGRPPGSGRATCLHSVHNTAQHGQHEQQAARRA